MPQYLQLIILFLSGVIAGFINVNAGGGSSLTLPVLMLLGLDSAAANGTNRIGILVQTVSSVSSFRKQAHSDFKKSIMYACCALPGAVAGSLFSVRLSDKSFKTILSIILIGIIISLFVKPDFTKTAGNTTEKRSWFVFPALVAVGFYGGFIQVGVGFLLMSTLYYTLHLSLVRVNMHKVFIVFIYTIPTITIFAVTGNIHLVFGIILAAGMAIGGWWGAHFAVKKGDTFIRLILVAAIVIIIIKLLQTL